jgi:hypothetical protein
MFVAVKGASAGDLPAPVVQAPVNQRATFWEKLLTAPKTLPSYAFVVFGAIILVALILAIMLGAHLRHPRLVFNGFLFVLIIVSVLALNHYLALYDAGVF